MFSPHQMPAPIHISASSNFHSPVEVVDHASNLNLEGLSPRSFGSSAGRGAFSPSRLSVSSLSCSRSPLHDATNIDHKFSHGRPKRSWSKGSDGPRSGTTTAVPTRHSSPVPAHTSVHIKAPHFLKPIITRPRGRSKSQRKVNLSLPLNRAARYPSRPGYPAGQIMPNLRRVGVEECRRWVTGTPPSAWPIVRATHPSRAHSVVTKDLPGMLEQAIKDVEYTLECLVTEQSLLFLHNQLALGDSEDIVQLEDKTRDLERCIDRMKVLLSEVRSNSALRPIEDDGEQDVRSWNRKLQHIKRADGSCMFFNAPTLFVEAYVYRRLRECFALSTSWKDYDGFVDRKRGDFVHSADRVLDLSQRFSEHFYTGDCVLPWEQLDKIRESFSELLSLCISQAPNSHESVLNITESQVEAAINNSHSTIFRGSPVYDGNHMWDSLSKNYANGGCRVDFVLNNAGLELYCDLALADFMIQTGLASKIYFHGKQFPWFVSHATRKDWDWLIGSLSNKHLFPYPTSTERTSLQQLGERWKEYEREGKFVYEQHPFWCTGLSFWELPTHSPDLFSRLSTSSLILFKGNLNHRRLTAGCLLPMNTSFGVAIGPMATHPRAPPVCSIRMSQPDRVYDSNEEYC